MTFNFELFTNIKQQILTVKIFHRRVNARVARKNPYFDSEVHHPDTNKIHSAPTKLNLSNGKG